MTLLTTVSLLVLSNAFMTLAWYGHLRFLSVPLWVAILGSWGIALIEYCFQVPANRLGYHAFSAYELKTIQEIITLSVFIVFAAVYLGDHLAYPGVGVGQLALQFGIGFSSDHVSVTRPVGGKGDQGAIGSPDGDDKGTRG